MPEILARLGVCPAGGRPLAFVALRCTSAVFLAFEEGGSSPEYVVKVGPRAELERAHAVQSRLHELLPGRTAASLGHIEIDAERGVHVQAGLAGLPWFHLSRTVDTPAGWDRLAGAALAALDDLHRAIRAVPEWRRSIRPGDALRAEWAGLEGRDALSRAVEALVRAAGEALDPLGEIEAPWQHGDFCINNLLVAGHTAGIVDFDELGRTAMPLHDRFGLALSVRALAAERGIRRPLRDEVARVLRGASEAAPFNAGQVAALFVHHLLFSVNACRERPRRDVRRTDLLRELEALAASPNALSAGGAVAP